MTKTNVNAAAFLAGISAKSPHDIVTKPRLSSPCGKLSEPSSGASACVATKACGVIQMALPMITIRNATLTRVCAPTVHLRNLPAIRKSAIQQAGRMKANLSGIGNLVQSNMNTTGMLAMRTSVVVLIRIRSSPSIRFILSQM